MQALMQAIAMGLQAFVTPLIGPVGILMITAGVAIAAIGVLWWELHLGVFWKVAISGIVLLAAGAIAAGLKLA